MRFFPLFPPQNTLPSLSRRSWGNNKPWVDLVWVWVWFVFLADSTPSAPSTASTTEWKYSRGAGSAAAAWS